MRVGYNRPGIYGVGYVGLGDSQDPVSRLDKIFNDHLQAAMLGQYGNPPPDPSSFASDLAGEVGLLCANVSFTTPCPPESTFAPMIDQYTQAYSQWLSTGYQGPGTTVYNSPAPAASTPINYQNAGNGLDRVTPQPTTVTQTPSQNALTPPQQQAPVTQTQTSTGNPVLAQNAGSNPFTDNLQVGTFQIPMWALLAGAGGLVLLFAMKGK